MRRSFVPLAIALLVSTGAQAARYADAIRAPRPAGGEWFGLYLKGKKIGYGFTDLTFAKGSRDTLAFTNTLVFRANLGNRIAERDRKEVRVYQAKPHGRLLSFTFVQTGDGGDQTFRGKCDQFACNVERVRPNEPPQTLALPASQETVDDADQARVAIFRHHDVKGTTFDGDDLHDYGLRTQLLPDEVRPIGGVKVRLHKTVTVSDRDKTPFTSYYTDQGALVEVDYSQMLIARAEPKALAQKLDTTPAEVFSLTRVKLPEPPPPDVRKVPGKLQLVLNALPEQFRVPSYRQKFQTLADGKVLVTLLAVPPKKDEPRAQLQESAELEPYLKSTLAVESDAPPIRKLAQQLVGQEKDSYAAAKRIVAWVGSHMENAYGVSADRATDALRQMKGDCTEHSLLSEALLRAAGIPARRIDGLIYVMNDDGVPALYWHEWVEAWVGEWTDLDPTFREPVADATHFALGEEGNAQITELIGSLEVSAVNPPQAR